jgi:hypothetical protein
VEFGGWLVANLFNIDDYRPKPVNPEPAEDSSPSAPIVPLIYPRKKWSMLPLPLPWEDPAELDAFISDYERRYPPRTITERHLLDSVISHSWRLRRLGTDVVKRRWAGNEAGLARLMKLATTNRASALRALERLHRDRNKPATRRRAPRRQSPKLH